MGSNCAASEKFSSHTAAMYKATVLGLHGLRFEGQEDEEAPRDCKDEELGRPAPGWGGGEEELGL